MKGKIKNFIWSELAIDGYFKLPDLIKTKHVYYKELDNGMILSLAIEESRLYKNKVTCSFYIAASYSYPMASPTFLPERAYQRIGLYLNLKEKKNVINKEYWYITDVWWSSDNKDDLLNFIKAIRIAEKNIISESSHILLEMKDFKFKDYHIYIKILNKILSILPVGILRYNENQKDYMNEIFVNSAKKVVKEENDIRNNKDGILFLAMDVWRCYFLSSNKNLLLIKEIATY